MFEPWAPKHQLEELESHMLNRPEISLSTSVGSTGEVERRLFLATPPELQTLWRGCEELAGISRDPVFFWVFAEKILVKKYEEDENTKNWSTLGFIRESLRMCFGFLGPNERDSNKKPGEEGTNGFVWARPILFLVVLSVKDFPFFPNPYWEKAIPVR